MKSIILDQSKGENRTRNGADHVRQIEITERSLRFSFPDPFDRRHRERVGCPHAYAPRNQCESDECSRNKVVASRRHGRASRNRREQTMSENQFTRNSKRRAANQELGKCIQAQRGGALDAPTAHEDSSRPGPRAHPQHEHGKRDRDKRRRDAILRHRQPKPNQFVENAAEPREEKKREIPAHPCSLEISLELATGFLCRFGAMKAIESRMNTARNQVAKSRIPKGTRKVDAI